MTDVPDEYRLYGELASWWPLISPAGAYAEDAACLERVFAAASVPVHEVLDLGSGGGHVAMHLKGARQRLTLVDRSAEMLAVSRALNPECEHVQADMLTIRLGRQFDAVLVHDAVDYVTTEAELRLVVDTAFAHCRTGGLAAFAPDHIADTFKPGTGAGGGGDRAGRQATFRERTFDPDPEDDWIVSEYEFTVRPADSNVQVVREAHRLGAFSARTWLNVLAAAGFDPEPGNVAEAYRGADGGGLRNLFVGHRG